MLLLRSVTVSGDRSPSTDRSPPYYNPTDEDPTTSDESGPKLRTFHGWKRNTGHLDKTRSTKHSQMSHVILHNSFSSMYFFDTGLK
jgi:hypothetical protein